MTKFKLIIHSPVLESDIEEAERLYPYLSTKEALQALAEQTYKDAEDNGDLYAAGAYLEVVELQ
jgi:hypothetical protein